MGAVLRLGTATCPSNAGLMGIGGGGELGKMHSQVVTGQEFCVGVVL